MLSKFRRVISFVVKSPFWKYQGHVDFCTVLSTVAIFTYFYFFYFSDIFAYYCVPNVIFLCYLQTVIISVSCTLNKLN